MTKKEILQELECFNNLIFEAEQHKYTLPSTDIKFTSVSKLKAKYKKQVPWEHIKKAIAKRDKTTYELVDNSWKHKAFMGTSRGTYIHEYIEFMIDNLGFPKYDQGIFHMTPEELADYFTKMEAMRKIADKYLEHYKEYEHVGSEIRVYDRQLEVSGTLDKLCIHPTKGLMQKDYKTDKQFRRPEDEWKTKGYMEGPLAHLVDCELVVYSLQQLIYKLIIEKNTNIKIPTENIHLIWIHPDNDTYEEIPILDLEDEAREVLSIHFTNLEEKKKQLQLVKGIKF